MDNYSNGVDLGMKIQVYYGYGEKPWTLFGYGYWDSQSVPVFEFEPNNIYLFIDI